MSEILLEIKNISACYQAAGRILPGEGRTIQALAGVSFRVARGEALGIIGESGSGKTTLARVAAGLLKPSAGDVCYDGRKHEFRRCQSFVQMVFQDPYSSLNPSLDVAAAVGEGLRPRKRESTAARRRKVAEALAMVGLPRNVLDRYPHQLSGGQQQRVALARALVTGPRLLVLDEPLAALDVLAQAHLLLLLAQLKTRLNLSYLFVSHNLAAVKQLCDRVAVIHAGRLVECGSVLNVLTQPEHEYTAKLLEAFLWPDPTSFHGTGRELSAPDTGQLKRIFLL